MQCNINKPKIYAQRSCLLGLAKEELEVDPSLMDIHNVARCRYVGKWGVVRDGWGGEDICLGRKNGDRAYGDCGYG